MTEENKRASPSSAYAPPPTAPSRPIINVAKPRHNHAGTRPSSGAVPPPRSIHPPPVMGNINGRPPTQVQRQIPMGPSNVANTLQNHAGTLKGGFEEGIEYTISEDRTAASGSEKNHLLFALKTKGLDHSTKPKPLPKNVPIAPGWRRISDSEESSDNDSPMDEESEKMDLLPPESILTSTMDLNLEDTLQLEGLTTNDYEKIVRDLAEKIHSLAATNAELRKFVSETKRDSSQVDMQTFYEIKDDDDDDDESFFYIGEPIWKISEDEVTLNGSFPVADRDAYLRRKGSVAFMIYKTYNASQQTSIAKSAIRSNRPIPDPQPFESSFKIVSDEMAKAVKAWFQHYDGFSSSFPDVRFTRRIYAPFIWWYHYRKAPRPTGFSDRKKKLVLALIEWIETEYSHLYDKIECQFQRGFVSHNSLEYLVKPGSTIIAPTNEGPKAYEVTSIPKMTLVHKISDLEQYLSTLGSSENSENLSRKEQRDKYTSTWDIGCRTVHYNGIFEYKHKDINLFIESEGRDDDIDITDLSVIPLEYANPDTIARLDRRGRMFWQCRKRKVVSYRKHNDTLTDAAQRFIVDRNTYNELHGNGARIRPSCFDMNQESPPPAPKLYLFPTTIHGFDLRHKKWSDLNVDYIEDVTWNKEAFDNLVVEPETKLLIQALVTNQLSSEKSTDLIDNKGNGLIMLLHGSPGTGKTFTAESVAEMAEKPLYPVTCGDIGTNPEQVEKYLTSVFHLGKVWGCVVLLDEAEVFLEQRNLSDLERNALVSVFLRALEYYEGILILTSNRVGTFDEAFKSRIQLALHYANLNQTQRKDIWRNFFKRLKTLDQSNIDFDDIESELDELSEFEMNGRQIRNAITTARQLAQFKGTKMRTAHLKQSIKVAAKFDNYLKDVKAGRSDKKIAKHEDEENARMEGIR